VWKASLMVV
jgi:hypothetical protein